MASFPGPKVHRAGNRRKLGRGQVVPGLGTTVTAAVQSADVMRITAAAPVVWSGAIPATVATRTIVSQNVVSQTQVDITFSGALAGLAWTVPGGAGTAYLGGSTAPASGSF